MEILSFKEISCRLCYNLTEYVLATRINMYLKNEVFNYHLINCTETANKYSAKY